MTKPVSRTAIPSRTQGSAVDYLGGCTWRLWLHTNDYIHGTFLTLFSNGMITRTTVRAEEGDDVVLIKPKEQ